MSKALPPGEIEPIRADDERWMRHALALAERAEREDD